MRITAPTRPARDGYRHWSREDMHRVDALKAEGKTDAEVATAFDCSISQLRNARQRHAIESRAHTTATIRPVTH